MTQLLLFDAGSSSVARPVGTTLDGFISRASDSITSVTAANEVSGLLQGYRAEFVNRLKQLGTATANEVARGNESVRKRARECARLGLIKECGVRACAVTGKQATVWEIAK